MILPVAHENEWAQALSHAPAWTPPSCPTLIIAPHPDDETLAAGGLIATLRHAGVEVLVVAVTDGENAYHDTPGLGPLRAREQQRALERLGVPLHRIVRFQLPDSAVNAHEHALLERLIPLVSQGTHVVAPWSRDFHPDHEACGRAAEALALKTGALLTSWLFWTWHRGTPRMLARERLRSFPLSDAAMSAKADALDCHQSQLTHDSGQPILPENLLAPARRNFETFLIHAN
jgi:LmbE family N-acetylglucosaminyl deacetylase